MVPLKVIVVGLRWELSIDLGVVVLCFGLIWRYLHRLPLPCSWRWTMGYATAVAFVCEMTHIATSDPALDPADVIETVHLEVLLPAFTIGCVVRAGHTSQEPDRRHPPGTPSHLLKRTATFMRRLRHQPSFVRERAARLSEAFINDIVS